jgi:hypothetical protein
VTVPDYRTPPGVTGLQMKDGTRYAAGRDGRVTVDRPEHARHIEHLARTDVDAVHRITVGGGGTASKHCPRCPFTAYAWQSTCPRCSVDLIREG